MSITQKMKEMTLLKSIYVQTTQLLQAGQKILRYLKYVFCNFSRNSKTYALI